MSDRTESISPNVVIMTRDEMQAAVTKSFHRGVERGKFEESCARSNTPAQGSAGHTEATENTGPASPDAAVRLANSDIAALVDKFLAWPLPKTVCSDLCVTDPNYQFQRSGTNLLNVNEAREMLEYLLTSPRT